MSRRLFETILVGFVLLTAGCVGEVTQEAAPLEAAPGGSVTPNGDLVVDRSRSGDRAEFGLDYKVTQFGETQHATGRVVLDVGEGMFLDGFGVQRPGTRVGLATSMTTEGETQDFLEAVLLDPGSQMQLHHEFKVLNNQVNRFPMEPLGQVPVSRQSSIDMRGFVEDFAPNPLGRGGFVYGTFVGNQTLVDGGSFEFWGVLQDFEPFVANIKAGETKDGVPTRTVTVDVTRESGPMTAAVTWKGEFRSDCPFPQKVHQTREYVMNGQTFSDELAAERVDCARGPLTTERPASVPWAERRAGEYVEWDRLPPDGTGPQFRFRLSEMYATLAQDPTASAYFAAHPDAYLQFAFLQEVNTCPVYTAASPPGCHWDTWRGFFQDGDKTQLHFTVERYSNDDGAGVTIVPLVEREYPLNAPFMVAPGAPPPLPPGPPRVITSTNDVPARDEVATHTYPVSAAIAVWHDTAIPAYTSLQPNAGYVWLGADGYEYGVSRLEWVYPDPAPAFPLYSSGVPVLDVHFLTMFGDGYLGFAVNVEFDVSDS